MPPKEDRLDPALLDPAELEKLMELVAADERPALVGREGVRIPLPDPIFHAMVKILREMQQGRAVMLVPDDETFTTQAAAEFLGMSRQHLVNLLEKDEIPHHRVGSHRRVALKDLQAYQKLRDARRQEARSRLFKRLADEGRYDSDFAGDAG